VPAIAVIQKGQTLLVIIRCKGYVGCYDLILIKKVNIVFYYQGNHNFELLLRYKNF